jgi:hypothetical protein
MSTTSRYDADGIDPAAPEPSERRPTTLLAAVGRASCRRAPDAAHRVASGRSLSKETHSPSRRPVAVARPPRRDPGRGVPGRHVGGCPPSPGRRGRRRRRRRRRTGLTMPAGDRAGSVGRDGDQERTGCSRGRLAGTRSRTAAGRPVGPYARSRRGQDDPGTAGPGRRRERPVTGELPVTGDSDGNTVGDPSQPRIISRTRTSVAPMNGTPSPVDDHRPPTVPPWGRPGTAATRGSIRVAGTR